MPAFAAVGVGDPRVVHTASVAIAFAAITFLHVVAGGVAREAVATRPRPPGSRRARVRRTAPLVRARSRSRARADQRLRARAGAALRCRPRAVRTRNPFARRALAPGRRGARDRKSGA